MGNTLDSLHKALGFQTDKNILPEDRIREWMETHLLGDIIPIILEYMESPLSGTLLLEFGGQGSGKEKMHLPSGMAHDHQSIYVCDTYNHRISVYSPNGKWLNSFGSRGKDLCQFQFPTSILIDERHYLLVSDKDNRRIQAFDKSGKHVEEYPLGFRCGGIAQREEELYICDLEHSLLVVYNKETRKPLRSWGREGSGSRALFTGSFSVAVDGDRVYVTDIAKHCVRVFDLQGQPVELWRGGAGTEKLLYPEGVFVQREDVYVGDHASIKVFDRKTGHIRQVVGGQKGSSRGELDSVDSLFLFHNHLYVLDRDNHRIQVFS